LFDEPFGLVVNRRHRLAGRDKADFDDLVSENLLINAGDEMAQELRACLQANGIVEGAGHQVETQEDLLASLEADLGVAIMPIRVFESNWFCCIPLKQLNLVRKVSAYAVAGRQRAIAPATLLNMLRAADWSFGSVKREQ
jgi:DNA-binding transcriptional LysR family regulator